MSSNNTGYSAKVAAKSVSPSGIVLTTFVATFPRFILPEINTHRVFSRNSASSRAIPVAIQMKKILKHPFVPEKFGKNQPGMQATQYLEGDELLEAQSIWVESRNNAVRSALQLLLGRKVVAEYFADSDWQNMDAIGDNIIHLLDEYTKDIRSGEHSYLNVHKQTANRLLEPYAWHTAIISGTEWENFFSLRIHKDAQPETLKAASLVLNAANNSQAQEMDYSNWHLPLVTEEEKESLNYDYDVLKNVSAGRCARVSAETHEGKRDFEKDIQLAKTLVEDSHMSPLEHQATPETPLGGIQVWSGNFRGWKQYRKEIPFESNYFLKESWGADHL